MALANVHQCRRLCRWMRCALQRYKQTQEGLLQVHEAPVQESTQVSRCRDFAAHVRLRQECALQVDHQGNASQEQPG